MSDLKTLLALLTALLLNLNAIHLGSCSKKSCGSKGIKKLSKSEVDVKTYLFPCSFDKDILNSTFGSNNYHLHNCKRKFVIKMTVNSRGECSSKTDGFIPVDHVIDGISGRKKKLLNPFMVRLKREKMYQLYDFQLVKSVNAEATEEVINFENTPNFTGCDTSSSHPTCGFSFFNNKIIQFSEGFCCSCNENKNEQRQPCESHMHESKDFPDMEYAVHRPRSNRTSRDLEMTEQNLDTLILGPDSRKEEVDNLQIVSTKLSPTVENSLRESDRRGVIASIHNNDNSKYTQSQHNKFTGQNSFPIDTDGDFKLALNSDFWNKNVTMKRFEFEHSIDKDVAYTVHPLNILIDRSSESENSDSPYEQEQKREINNANKNDESEILKTVELNDSAFNNLIDMEGDLNEYFDNFKHTGNANNPIDNEKFRQSVMRRIKEEKNDEETSVDRDSHLNDSNNLCSKICTRCEKTNSNGNTLKKFGYVKKNGKNGFSLKLENNNSELRLQIVTKRPKNTTKNEGAAFTTKNEGVDFTTKNEGVAFTTTTKNEGAAFTTKNEGVDFTATTKNEGAAFTTKNEGADFTAMSEGTAFKSPDESLPGKFKDINGSCSGLRGDMFPGELKSHNTSNESLPIYNTTKINECTTYSTEWETKCGIKQRIIQNSVLKYFKASKNNKTTTTKNPKLLTTPAMTNIDKTTQDVQFTTTCDTALTPNDSNSNLLPSRSNKTSDFDLNKCNATTNITNIESLMYKLVPVINTVQNLKTNGEGFKKADGFVADTDNETYKVYIELEKKSHMDKNDKLINSFQGIQSSVELGNKANQFEFIPNDPIAPAEYSCEIIEENSTDGMLENSRLQLTKNNLQSNYLLKGQVHDIPAQNIQKREAAYNTQTRGGQSCVKEGKVLPCNANPETYFESAHCLRFSDLWYNVFKLLNPRLENSITVKIYAKHKTPAKRICWENLSKRLPGRVGTVNEVLTDDAKNIMITYSSDDKVAFNLDCASDYILVPQPLPRNCKDAELKTLSCGGPEEYLVLRENEITFDGEECDKAGVSYAAFARQLHRCQQEPGTCLKNQPLHYWRQDKIAEKDRKRGHYFLNNFIEVTDQAILQNTTSNQVVLRAPYFERYQSQIVIEMNADHIEIIGDKTEGQITEVYTDATSDKITIVKAVVTNLGVSADFFGVDFANCSTRLGPSDFDKPGKDEIPPQHRITYTATISSPLKNKRVDCKMVLYNMDQELIASRHIIIVQGQRCMCVWYCQCVCHNHPHPGLPCNPLSVKEYNRAGFPGHLPVIIGSHCSTIFTILHALLWFFLFLLLFGLIKAILGLCFCAISLWGLWYLLPDEAKSLNVYLEPHLANCSVIRDCDGFPIHPRTCRRDGIHFLPWYSEFVVNVFFFICVLRSCICDHGSYRENDPGYYYRDPRCYPRTGGRNKCSPGCSVMRGSPCNSVCSKRRNRKFRVSAGAEEEFLSPEPQLLKDDEWAKHLVDELTRSYVVFRVLTRPLGGVKSVPGTPYCVRGFFLESENGVYQFNPPSPLMQIWKMDGTPLDPPLKLDPIPFHAIYNSAREVLGAHELCPWARGIVINAP